MELNENGISSSENIERAIDLDNAAEAEKAKDAANKDFKDKHYSKAVAGYTTAIELNPFNAVYYSNRAAANIRLENYGSAVADATKALDVDPKYAKGYYRRGDANFALLKFKLALKDFKSAARLAPKDPDLRKKMAECEKEVKRIRFEEALSTPTQMEPSVVETLDLSEIEVEESYTGPRMDGSETEGYKISLPFILAMMEAFKAQQSINRRFAFEIILAVRTILMSLPTLVDVAISEEASFTVCGDVHGQFYDLMNIFEINGLPSPENPYLFNGDFVDRGSFSVEVILTLFAFKALYPAHMHLARGNHESNCMNKIYGFEGEVKAKFNATMASVFRETFCYLPLAHCLNGKVFVLHGGLFSRDGVTLADIRAVDRVREPPEEGLMCEMLWSDPQAPLGRAPSKRGVGVAFGPDVTKRFLEDNDLQLVVRSHEVKDKGYEIEHDGYCVTVFSAPNYCDQMGNKGAFIRFRGGDMTPQFTSYDAVPHPPIRPMQYATGMLGGMFGF